MIKYTPHLPSPKDFQSVRGSAGWSDISIEEAQTALKRSLCGVSAYEGEACVGIARVIGDGVLNIYIQDVVIAKTYRGIGIGKAIMTRLISDMSGYFPNSCTVGLLATKGQEGFYQQFGFIQRPTHVYGAGMFAALGELSALDMSAGKS